ncbi:uncharacterized protein LOC124434846 isoform X1 [Xenia sp. Carnegie-2017]|uniref:uncharacterized protein LOC124434846 isoform X1 n=1 Tax=Xenia sp. Carnegie-2017 TaxID=2897299 RepID=UPI001F042497|nr:uncharacterized protein LOC124434846 isoform X1 [Xenia sp. Carnegie-2017]
MMNVRLLWGGTLKIVKPLAFERVQSFCHSFWRNDGKYQKSATVFDGVSKSNLGKDITNDQAIITPVNKDINKISLTEKRIDILSFDGGGSRGIMQLKILDDVLRLASIVLRNPETVEYLVNEESTERKKHFLEDLAVRECLINNLKVVKDPIHPTDVYDMIVGTGIGGLISFGLVGGNKVEGNNHERKRMTVEECIETYRSKTKIIFKKTCMQKIIDFLFRLSFIQKLQPISFVPLTTYSQANIEKILKDQFGDCDLNDFRKNDNSSSVVGVVAKRICPDEHLVLFDTANEDQQKYKVYEVLLATSNSPFYFSDTVVTIGNAKYIEGGLGGNCPLKQAISRAQELFNNAKIVSVLSVAPPSFPKLKAPSTGGFITWMSYLSTVSIDGNIVFEEVVKSHTLDETLFQRLSPRGNSLKTFKLDEIDIKRILDAMEEEKVQDDMFLVDVVASAMAVVLASIDKVEKIHKDSLSVAVKLAKAAGLAYESKKEYKSAIVSHRTRQRLHTSNKRTQTSSKVSNGLTTIMTSYDIAKCYKEQGDYSKAFELFKSNVDTLANQKFDDQKYDDLIVDNLIEKLHCYLQTFQYQNAEKCLNKISHYEIRDEKRVQVLIYKAWYSRQQGKLEETFNLYRDAAKITLDNDNFDKAEILNNMGLLFIDLGMKDEAFDFIQKAQHVRVKLIGQKDDGLLAESHENVGLCLVEKGDGKNAKKELQKAIEIYYKIGDEIKISNVLQTLARCMLLQDHSNYNRAISYAQEALQKMKPQVPTVDNPGTAKILSIFGRCFLETGRFEEAEENLVKASRLIEDSLSKNHPQLMEIYDLLSQLYDMDGKPKLIEAYKNKKKGISDEIEKKASIVQLSDQYLTWKKQ